MILDEVFKVFFVILKYLELELLVLQHTLLA